MIGRHNPVVNKPAIVLVWILLLSLFVSACNPQAVSPVSTSVPPVVLTPSAANPLPTSAVPENTKIPLPQPTSTSEPTASPIPVIQTAAASPTMVETELPAGATRVSETDQMEQVYVPAGEFIMGSDSPLAKRTIEGGRAYPEIPVNTVYLDGYWIDKFEVTTGQYGKCVEAGVCREPWNPASDTHPSYFGNEEFANYPVIWINWSMARNYCEWVGRRLPTEAEWEKAARGTDGQEYPWGNDPISGDKANFCDVNCNRTIANGLYDDGYTDVAPVGSYPAGASPYGAMDMAGNVWEWTGTLIMPYPYDASDGREDLDAPGERAWRGAPYSNGIWWMRSSVRYRSVPTYWWMNLGFRCASSN